MPARLDVFLEADLQAFIDGQMAEGERESFLEFLVNNPEEAERARLYREQAEALQHRAEQMLEGPTPDRLSEILARARKIT